MLKSNPTDRQQAQALYWSLATGDNESTSDKEDEQNIALLAAALASARRETWKEVETLCDSLVSGAISDYGVGYENAMKEISVHAEIQAGTEPR